MLFNSFHFLFFFPIVVGLYFVLPHRFRWAFLLAASYYFYACWKAEYLLLIIFSTLVDYWAGLQMGKREEKVKRRPFLYASLAANLGLLFFFKYFNFFNETTRAIFQQFNLFYGVPAFDILLPVGISFYTFQTLSYAIDVYNGTKSAEKHLGIFALYVSFFPQLVAGPIERSQKLLPQFHERQQIDYQRIGDGLKRMAWGFFKKLVIADRLAVFVNAVYNQPDAYSGWTILLASYCFLIQLYCDFSAYSDIAIGAARALGYDLMENFRRPFFAKSIQDFWDRWHISLTTWFRDYLFLPLAWRKKVSPRRWFSSMFLTFTIIGFWHGANFTFILVGVIHGIYLVVGSLTLMRRKKAWDACREWVAKAERHIARKLNSLVEFLDTKLPLSRLLPTVRDKLLSRGEALKSPLDKGRFRGVEKCRSFCTTYLSLTGLFDLLRQWFSMFIAFNLVIFSIVFFRANSVADAFALLGNFANFTGTNPAITGWTEADIIIVAIAIVLMFTIHVWEEKKQKNWLDLLNKRALWTRRTIYIALILMTILFARTDTVEFVYFQF